MPNVGGLPGNEIFWIGPEKFHPAGYHRDTCLSSDCDHGLSAPHARAPSACVCSGSTGNVNC
jgi:hypothetical protein